MKKAIISLILIILFLIKADKNFASTREIKKIRFYYKNISSKIKSGKLKKKSISAKKYKFKNHSKSERKKHPEFYNHTRTTAYYDEKTSVIYKIIHASEDYQTEHTIECLYNRNGDLLFYYLGIKSNGENSMAERYYLKNKKLLRLITDRWEAKNSNKIKRYRKVINIFSKENINQSKQILLHGEKIINMMNQAIKK